MGRGPIGAATDVNTYAVRGATLHIRCRPIGFYPVNLASLLKRNRKPIGILHAGSIADRSSVAAMRRASAAGSAESVITPPMAAPS